MKPIVNFALLHADIEPAHIINAINHLPEEMQDRFAELVLGIIDEEEIIDDIPRKGKAYKDRPATFIEYNYLTDKVKYECEDDNVRYFDTLENAELFTKNGTIKGKNSWCKTDDCIYEGVQWRKVKTETDLYSWLSYCNKK